jgi:hypothetical protein
MSSASSPRPTVVDAGASPVAEGCQAGALAWFAALAQAQEACGQIERGRWNEHGKNHYASAGDIVGSLRPVLHAAGLIVFELTSEPLGELVEVQYSVVHVGTGYERRFVHRMALPAQLKDKALTAARTVGMRDFLRGLLVPHMVEAEPAPSRHTTRLVPRGGPPGQGQGQATQTARPVSATALPIMLAASDLLHLDDREAYDLVGVPADRGQQLVLVATRLMGFDLAEADDAARGRAIAGLRRRAGEFQEAVHRWGIDLLALALVQRGAEAPAPAQVARLQGADLLSMRRRLEVALRGAEYGWEPGPCNGCGGKSTLVKGCKVCSGTGSIRSARPRPRPGSSA